MKNKRSPAHNRFSTLKLVYETCNLAPWKGGPGKQKRRAKRDQDAGGQPLSFEYKHALSEENPSGGDHERREFSQRY